MINPSQMLMNALADRSYCPYCMRCPRAVRMNKTQEDFLWNHTCGAIHDERENTKVSVDDPDDPYHICDGNLVGYDKMKNLYTVQFNETGGGHLGVGYEPKQLVSGWLHNE